MKKQEGVTLITVIIMVIIIGIISTLSVVTSKGIFNESKEEVLKKNRFLVETAVSKYSAKVSTSGVLSPAFEELPGIKNPTFESGDVDDMGNAITVRKNVGENWYLLLEDSLEEMGVTYAEENYLVNYKLNVVIPLSQSDEIFELVKYYENLY